MQREVIEELQDLLKDIISLLEEKEKRLLSLLNKADRRISELKFLLDKVSDKEENDFLDSELGKNVISLYKRGINIRDIAMQLGAHQGEVELIINLYRTKYEGSSGREIV